MLADLGWVWDCGAFSKLSVGGLRHYSWLSWAMSCRYLKMLTFLPLEQIDKLEADMQQSEYKPNTAQRLLAEQVLLFVHGNEGLSAALAATQVSWILYDCHSCMCHEGSHSPYSERATCTLLAQVW